MTSQEKMSARIPQHKKSPAMLLADRKRALVGFFGPGADACIEKLMLRELFGKIDVIALDDFLLQKHQGDYDEEKESMAEFITRKYGKAAADFVEANI